MRRVGRASVCVAARGRADHGRCPECGRVSTAVHSRYCRRPADLPSLGREIHLSVQVRRFYCRNGACSRRTFAEQLSGLLAPYARRTRRLGRAQGRVGAALGGEAGARLLPHLAMPASAATVLRLVRRLPLPARRAVRVLGVDDWARKKGRTYGTILVDLERRRAIDLLPDRTSATLAAWLRRRTSVRIITRDRSTEYSLGAATGAPAATQVADRWHLLVNGRQMVERWLAGAHARLRRLPVIAGEAPSSARRTRAYPRSPAEAAAREGNRARRAAIHAEVRRRYAAGETLRGISRAMRLGRGTVRKFAAAEGLPERVARGPGPSILDPHLSHLEGRLAAGCENAMALWRELRDRGFSGSSRQVRRWMTERRSAPAKTTPTQWRRAQSGSSASAAGAPLPSPTQLAWLLVQPPAKLPAAEAVVVARIAQDREAALVGSLARRFADLVHRCSNTARDKKIKPLARLDAWLTEARSCGVSIVESFAAGLLQDGAAVRAALTTSWSNGQAEGQITKLKLLKRSMYGRASFDLLRRRMLLAA